MTRDETAVSLKMPTGLLEKLDTIANKLMDRLISLLMRVPIIASSMI